jgi:hypothetical protein
MHKIEESGCAKMTARPTWESASFVNVRDQTKYSSSCTDMKDCRNTSSANDTTEL